MGHDDTHPLQVQEVPVVTIVFDPVARRMIVELEDQRPYEIADDRLLLKVYGLEDVFFTEVTSEPRGLELGLLSGTDPKLPGNARLSSLRARTWKVTGFEW